MKQINIKSKILDNIKIVRRNQHGFIINDEIWNNITRIWRLISDNVIL